MHPNIYLLLAYCKVTGIQPRKSRAASMRAGQNPPAYRDANGDAMEKACRPVREQCDAALELIRPGPGCLRGGF